MQSKISTKMTIIKEWMCYYESCNKTFNSICVSWKVLCAKSQGKGRIILMKGITYKMTPLWKRWGTFEELKDNCGLNEDSIEERRSEYVTPEVTFIY